MTDGKVKKHREAGIHISRPSGQYRRNAVLPFFVIFRMYENIRSSQERADHADSYGTFFNLQTYL